MSGLTCKGKRIFYTSDMETVEVYLSDFSDCGIKEEYEKRFGKKEGEFPEELIKTIRGMRFALYMGYEERVKYLARDAVQICEDAGLLAE